MITKFRIDAINGNGQLLMDVVRMIANHNSGKSKIDLDMVCGYAMAEKAKYPETNKGLAIQHSGSNPSTVSFSDNNGESYYLTITECTFEELIMPNQLENLEHISQTGEQC
jgi:hypothetical protein